MVTFKRYIRSIVITLLTLLMVHLVPLILVNPMNILCVDATKNEFYIKEMRFQSAAIINKFNFDSVIIGSSMTENFNAKEASNKIGGTFQNLSLSGSLLNERKVVLEYLFTKKKIKTLVMSIDGVTTFQRNKGIPITAWGFLYNDNSFDDLFLYISKKYCPYVSCHSLFANDFFSFFYGDCPADKIRNKIESLTEWQSIEEYRLLFGGLDNWLANRNSYQISKEIQNIINAKEIILHPSSKLNNSQVEKLYDPVEFSTNIIPLVRQHPTTRFVLFFPPYSIYHLAINAQSKPQIHTQYKEMVRQIVSETMPYSNVDIYWFFDKEFIGDIANYKDLTHYSGDISSLILDEFRLRKSIINTGNYKSLLCELEKKVMAVDLIEFSRNFE